jgi:hypothetical protein
MTDTGEPGHFSLGVWPLPGSTFPWHVDESLSIGDRRATSTPATVHGLP